MVLAGFEPSTVSEFCCDCSKRCRTFALARPSLRRLTRRALARPALRGLQAFKAGIFVDVKKEVDGG